MSKRFTDTEKWKDAWFRSLSLPYQHLWLFLLDYCNNAGIFEWDMDVFRFHIKGELKEEDIDHIFEKKITFLSGNKFIINKFMQFQQGSLSPNSAPHREILRILRDEGLCSFSIKIEGKKKVIYENLNLEPLKRLLSKSCANIYIAQASTTLPELSGTLPELSGRAMVKDKDKEKAMGQVKALAKEEENRPASVRESKFTL